MIRKVLWDSTKAPPDPPEPEVSPVQTLVPPVLTHAPPAKIRKKKICVASSAFQTYQSLPLKVLGPEDLKPKFTVFASRKRYAMMDGS